MNLFSFNFTSSFFLKFFLFHILIAVKFRLVFLTGFWMVHTGAEKDLTCCVSVACKLSLIAEIPSLGSGVEIFKPCAPVEPYPLLWSETWWWCSGLELLIVISADSDPTQHFYSAQAELISLLLQPEITHSHSRYSS